VHWFETLEEAKAIIEDWRRDYNKSRPHSTLNDLAPAEFVAGRPSKPCLGLTKRRKLTPGMIRKTQADH